MPQCARPDNTPSLNCGQVAVGGIVGHITADTALFSAGQSAHTGPKMPKPTRFYGKYRGQVTTNIDPEQIGRVMVQVPDVTGLASSSWAMPCVPAAGMQAGCFIVPPIGSQVWVEFEQGDPDHPIWTGGFWGSAAEVPIVATTPPATPPGQNIVFQTTGRNMITVSDAPSTAVTGGVILKSATGAMVVVNDTGIHISNGKGAVITLVGPTVDVNGGALTVI